MALPIARSPALLGLLLFLALEAGCARAPAAVPPPHPTARAIAFSAARTLVPYTDPDRTFTLRRPQTWVALDARSAPQLARDLGDGVRFFEPITAADPDAGSSGMTPRQVLLAPFVAADYPATLLARMSLASTTLGGVPAYRLVTLAARTQVMLLLARWRAHYYRITIFSPTVPAEVAPVLQSWRFLS